MTSQFQTWSPMGSDFLYQNFFPASVSSPSVIGQQRVCTVRTGSVWPRRKGSSSGVATPVSDPGFDSRLFHYSKKTGGWRPILHSQHSKSGSTPFKWRPLSRYAMLYNQGLGNYDRFKICLFTVPIHPRFNQFFLFHFGKYCLPVCRPAVRPGYSSGYIFSSHSSGDGTSPPPSYSNLSISGQLAY